MNYTRDLPGVALVITFFTILFTVHRNILFLTRDLPGECSGDFLPSGNTYSTFLNNSLEKLKTSLYVYFKGNAQIKKFNIRTFPFSSTNMKGQNFDSRKSPLS